MRTESKLVCLLLSWVLIPQPSALSSELSSHSDLPRQARPQPCTAPNFSVVLRFQLELNPEVLRPGSATALRTRVLSAPGLGVERLKGGAASPGLDDYTVSRDAWLSGQASNSEHQPQDSGTPTSALAASAPPNPWRPAPQAPQSPATRKRSSWKSRGEEARAAKESKTARASTQNRKERVCTVTLAYKSEEQFCATSPYTLRVLTDAYKSFLGEYDTEHKRWVFSMTLYDRVLSTLKRLETSSSQATKIKILPIPDTIRGAMKKDATLLDPQEHFERIPEDLRGKLMPFQREGVEFGISRAGRVLIGDEMGLGKTIQAIAIAAAFQGDWPLLVVCPSSMRCMWAQELRRWLPEQLANDTINVIFTGKDKILEGRKATIISYDLFIKFEGEIAQAGFGIVIADESHYLKNSQAKRTKAVTPLLKNSQRAILLTGTPALARPIELFCLLNSLHQDMFSNYYNFAKRYCDARQGPFGLETGGSSNLEELHMVLQKKSMIRRLKNEVLTQLPAKRRQRIFLSVSSKEKQQFSAEMQVLRDLDKSICGGQVDSVQRQSAEGRKKALIMKMYVDTGQAKVAPVKEYIGDLIDCGAKFLVFAHHMVLLDGIEDTVKAKKVKYIRIDGSTAPQLRQELVTRFQEEEGVKVAVLSVTAAGTGLTLTAAHTVIFAELHWTPGILLQAEDRAHRIGQKTAVNIHYLLAQGTCDDLIWESIAHKMKVVGRALDGQHGLLHAVKSGYEESLHESRKKHQALLPGAMPGSKISAAGTSIDRNANEAKEEPHNTMSSFSPEEDAFEIFEARQHEEADQVQQLLTHPTVLAAMENPRLEQVFEELMQHPTLLSLSNSDLLKKYGDDPEFRALFQVVNATLYQAKLPGTAKKSGRRFELEQNCSGQTSELAPGVKALRGGAASKSKSSKRKPVKSGAKATKQKMGSKQPSASRGDSPVQSDQSSDRRKGDELFHKIRVGVEDKVKNAGDQIDTTVSLGNSTAVPEINCQGIEAIESVQSLRAELEKTKSELAQLKTLSLINGTAHVKEGSAVSFERNHEESLVSSPANQWNAESHKSKMFAFSENGQMVSIEEVSSHDLGDGAIEQDSGTMPPTEPDGNTIGAELEMLAQNFPSCAQYLRNEFGSRRLMSVEGSRISEVKIRNAMTKIAQKSMDMESRLMALLIRERLGGGMRQDADPKISTELNPMPEEERHFRKKLEGCKCTLTASMACNCTILTHNIDEGVASDDGSMDTTAANRLLDGDMLETDRSHAGVPNSQGSQPLKSRSIRTSGWRAAKARKSCGGVVLQEGPLREAIQRLGGLEVVDGRQGKRGLGWKYVAKEIGVDINKVRDAGYVIKNFCLENVFKKELS